MPTQHFIALGQEGEKENNLYNSHSSCKRLLCFPQPLFPFLLSECWRLFSLKSPKKKKKWEGMFLGLAKVKYDLIMDRPNEWQAIYKFKNYTVIEVEMDPKRSCWSASAESSTSVEGHLYKGEIKGRRGNAEELENTSLSYSVYDVMRNCCLGSTCIGKSYWSETWAMNFKLRSPTWDHVFSLDIQKLFPLKHHFGSRQKGQWNIRVH